MTTIEFHRLKIADVRRETPDAVSIAFAVPSDLRDAYRFQPGQHLTLRTEKNGEDIRRSYSICTGLDDGELRVAIKKVEGGAFSTLCNELFKPGDEIDVMTPQGRFGLAPDPAKARNYLAIVAGSGITPVLSLLRSILGREPKSRFALIYGNRSTPDIIFKEALEDLKDSFVDRFVVHHVLSREQQDFALFNGRIDGEKIGTLVKSFAAPDEIDHAFLCGPGGLIEEGKRALISLGVPADRVHAEYFSTDGLPVTPRVASDMQTDDQPAIAIAHVTFDGSAYDLPIRAGETIIDAGLRAGLELPFSCRGGMCCTCRAKLVSGEVRMDTNYSLEPWEMQAGFVLTCQSHPLTPEVTVDYDTV
jgi:ring-1,2-phenylacetyl-CoA epoxidase subunit PaaE